MLRLCFDNFSPFNSKDNWTKLHKQQIHSCLLVCLLKIIDVSIRNINLISYFAHSNVTIPTNYYLSFYLVRISWERKKTSALFTFSTVRNLWAINFFHVWQTIGWRDECRASILHFCQQRAQSNGNKLIVNFIKDRLIDLFNYLNTFNFNGRFRFNVCRKYFTWLLSTRSAILAYELGTLANFEIWKLRGETYLPHKSKFTSNWHSQTARPKVTKKVNRNFSIQWNN